MEASHKTDVDPLRFRIKVWHDADDGVWYGECPDLPAAHTFGESKQEVHERLRDLLLDALAMGFHVDGDVAVLEPQV